MQPCGNSGLDEAEAVRDGTALIGHFDPDETDRLDVPPQQRASQRPDEHTIGRDWNRISARLAELFSTGVPAVDERAQDAIAEHYRWICYFWTPDRDSYLRLAGMYVAQPKFRKRIERKKPVGLAAYMREAMTAFAHARLR